MPEEKISVKKNNFSPDWLVRGVLTKIGDTFDKLTGRGWKPSSSLATSELIEKLKALLDLEVKDLGDKGKFVPHNIKLKMQWDKFSTDSDSVLVSLQNELLTAAIDHINDNRYHTFAPFNIEVKPDYFTEGVKILASFDKFADDDDEVEVKVTVPNMNVSELALPEIEPQIKEEMFAAVFSINGIQKTINLQLKTNSRLSIGRSKENDLTIEDASVSKIHASLVLNSENLLLVADTGSTNGTFVNNERIAYGKAFQIGNNDKVKFGNIDVVFRHLPKPTEMLTETETRDDKSVLIDGFEFKSKNSVKDEMQSSESIINPKVEVPLYETEHRVNYDFDKKDK